MKKLAILVTSLVLGASSVALADHTTVAPADPYAPSTIRDHRDDKLDGSWRRPRPHRWSVLASNAMLYRGRAVIDVDSNRRFTKLSLDANGRLFVDKLLITFGNGQTQTVELDKRLGRRGEPLMIDLDGNARMIDKVVVIARGARFRSSITLKAI